MIKTLQKEETEGIYLNTTKAIYNKPKVIIILKGEKKAESTSSKLGDNTKRPTLATFIQHTLGGPSHCNQRGKKGGGSTREKK